MIRPTAVLRHGDVDDDHRDAPRLVLVDFDAWDAFYSFAAAVRRRGVRVSRITRRMESQPLLRALVDTLVYGRDASNLTQRDREVSEAMVALVGEPPTVDLEGPEDVVADVRRHVTGTSLPDCWARVPRASDVNLLFDKWAMTWFAADLGIPVPTTRREHRPGDFPTVVKSAVSSGGQGVRIVRDEEELAQAMQDLGPADQVFFQDFSAGDLVTFGGVAAHGRLTAGSAYEAVSPAHFPLGPATGLRTIRDERIEADVRRLLGALDYTGPFCIDYIVTADGVPLLIDFNPRVFGSWLALQQAGVAILEAYLNTLELGPVPAFRHPKPGTVRRIALRPARRPGGLRDAVRELAATLRAIINTRPVTGSRFVLAFSLRSVLLAARDLGLRHRG